MLSGCAPHTSRVNSVADTHERASARVARLSVLPAVARFEPVAGEEENVDRDLVAAINGMGLDLVQQLCAAAMDPTNVFVSPLSIALALGMAANGASGKTLAAILKTLHMDGWGIDAANKGLSGLVHDLHGDSVGAELAVANSLWLRQGLPFRQDYLEAVRAHYQAHVSSLDLRAADAADTINAWVAEQTRERIKEIIAPPIDPQAILFLINAVYFKGAWSDPFDPSATRELPFTRADETAVEAPLMSRRGSYRHAAGRDYQAVRLPYNGDRLSMIVVVPARGRGLDRWAARLDARAWSNIGTSLLRAEGTVVIPRFKVAFESTLNEPLSAMGMAIALSPATAQFDRIHELDVPTWISQVRHKSFVEVNEEGTKAAAVTSGAMRALAAVPAVPFNFVADRPFLYAIQDELTGVLLFVGVMHDPLLTESMVFA